MSAIFYPEVATPADWENCDDVIIVPSFSNTEAKEKFPDGWKTLKPYLRIVSQRGKLVTGLN